MLSCPSPHRIIEVVRPEVWLLRAEGGRIDVAPETQARGDRFQAAPGGCPGLARTDRGGCDPHHRVTEVTYYRWRQEYGGLKSDQVKHMKELETENQRLRKAVADLTLDKLILQEAARGNF